MDATTKKYIEDLHFRLEKIEKGGIYADMKMNEIARNQGKATNAGLVRANIRQMFIANIIRDAGLVDKVDIEGIAARVRDEFSEPTYGVSVKFASRVIESTIRELKGLPPEQDDED